MDQYSATFLPHQRVVSKFAAAAWQLITRGYSPLSPKWSGSDNSWSKEQQPLFKYMFRSIALIKPSPLKPENKK